MIKLYKAIQGRKTSLIGEGETLIEAINDAGILFYDGIETDEQKEDHIKAAYSDYVIVEE